jgi:hypothetical protein
MVTFGGVDTYYDYDEKCWKYRRLGGGPVHNESDCPLPADHPPKKKAARAKQKHHSDSTARSADVRV